MNLVLVGLNHETAPVEYRERFYLADEALRVALDRLHRADLAEVVILSTCNRLEVYAAADDAASAFARIAEFLGHDTLDAHLYRLQGLAAVEHLMRVASGLESLILGETQILGQVAQALAQAQAAETAGAQLTRLFSDALHTGKRAQSETAISRYSLSVSDAAVALVAQQVDDLTAARVLVVGAGEVAELAVRALQRRGTGALSIINRTDANAERLAERFGIHRLKWTDLTGALGDADVVIAATGALSPIIHAEDLAQATNLLLVDVGVPRNVARDVSVLPRVRLYDIDDLRAVVRARHADLQAEVEQAEVMIAGAAEAYWGWLHSRQVVPLISEMRQQAEAVAEMEVGQALRRLPGLSEDEQAVVAQMAHRIVNKLLHAPTVGLKARAAHGDHFAYSHAVRQLFALDAEPVNDD